MYRRHSGDPGSKRDAFHMGHFDNVLGPNDNSEAIFDTVKIACWARSFPLRHKFLAKVADKYHEAVDGASQEEYSSRRHLRR
jgi:hypothetical protein